MASTPVKFDFPIHEVVALTGFTKYMLDYLARDKIFVPSERATSGRGVRRRYTYEDVVLLRALHRICANNGRIRHLREALLKFRNEFGPISPKQKLDKQLFVQGNELCCYTSAEGGRQIRSGQMTFSFVIDLSAVSGEIAKCIVMDKSDRGFRLTQDIAERAEAERQRIWAPIRARRASGTGSV